MGRYRVELAAPGSILRQYYSFHWTLISNLGVDLLIVPFSKLFGLELGVKLIVMAIPAMTVTAMLLIAREVHGRIPPTAFFALPLAYSYPFQYGFVNFALSMALALLAFALWLRLARLGRFRTRAIIFLLIAPIIWVTHIFGLGMLGLLAFCAEIVRLRSTAIRWPNAILQAATACLVLVPPLIIMATFRNTGGSAPARDWFLWSNKLDDLGNIFRDRWYISDLLSLIVVGSVLVFAVFSRKFQSSRTLAVGAMLLLAVYLVLPRVIFNSEFADMRLAPFVLVIALLAIAPSTRASPRFLNTIAIVGLFFFGVKLAAGTISFAAISSRQERALGALDHLPVGARMIAFTDDNTAWHDRLSHLPAMAIVRRQAYSNDQWNVMTMNMMRSNKKDAGSFASDPSHLVYDAGTGGNDRLISLDAALVRFPKDAFDYLWLINPPKYDARLTSKMTEIWRDGNDVLLRINH
ncbi:MAG: hypothetical protein JWO15_2772 [Sphingomonadales bacterium]|nr:hypothetical protein [Sphingomonadales bacterium]